MATRQKPSFDERVAEYVDSPMMRQRLHYGKYVCAQIQGTYGSYRTLIDCDASDLTGQCTCPSELWPCKHLYALRATWERVPGSFFNLTGWLAEFSKRTKKELVEAMGELILHTPGALAIFGVPGFGDEDDDADFH